MYSEAIDDLLIHVSQHPFIYDIWQYGTTTVQGISDLDLIAVIHSQSGRINIDSLHKSKLPKSTVAAMQHANLIIIPKEYSSDIFYWDDIDCRSLKGYEICQPQIDTDLRDIASFIDWFFERTNLLYREIQSHDKDIHIKTLGLMKSYLFSVQKFIRMSSCKLVEQEYSESRILLEYVRINWLSFDDQSKKKYSNRVRECFLSLLQITYTEAFEWLSENGPDLIPECNTYDLRALNMCNHVTYQFSTTHHMLSRTNKICVPKYLTHHFNRYLGTDRLLGQHLFKTATINPNHKYQRQIDSSPYARLLSLRFNAAASWFDFNISNNITFGLYKFGWCLNGK